MRISDWSSDVCSSDLDGQRVTLQLNLELPREMEQAAEAGAEGIGLLRTEFLYMNRPDLPDEEEQYRTLADIVRAMGGRPVTVRKLDVGGEKPATSLDEQLGESVTTAIGLRAIPLSLREQQLLLPQLAATLRSAQQGPLPILRPTHPT